MPRPDDKLREYNVHYGNKASQAVQTQVEYNVRRSTTVTTFSIGGMTTAAVCRHCVRKSRLLYSLSSLGSIILGFVLIGVFSYPVPPLSWLGLLMVLGGMIVFFVPLGGQWPHRMAVDIVRKSFRTQQLGYDTFWTDKEFAALTPPG